MLCENPLNGGGGYSPSELSEWTPDQIYFRAASVEAIAKSEVQQKRSAWECTHLMNAQGNIKGRDADGNVLTKPLLKEGKSYAAYLREQQLLQSKATERQSKRKRHRRGT